jgi:outer membrane protein OmpA-like peptidoglycan-associated protein/osmotically-inducible protein OsmY
MTQATIVPPTVSPYAWQAERNEAGLTLSGLVPSEADRQAINAAAAEALPGVPVIDRMRLALGAPAGFLDAARFGVGQVARLASGVASLDGAAYALRGAPANEADRAGLLAPALPPGFTAAPDAVALTPPPASEPAPAPAPVADPEPYAIRIQRNAAGVALTGVAPDAGAIAAIAEAAGAAFPGVAVDNALAERPGAPANFSAAVGYGLGQLSRLATGTFGLRDRAMTLAGVAPTLDAQDAVRARLATPPRGFAMTQATIVPPTVSPYAWQAERNEAGLMLSGLVPSEAAQRRLSDVARAAFPGLAVTDGTRFAAGAPDGFEAMAASALGQLSALDNGRAALDGAAFSISGAAGSHAVFDRALADAARLPSPFTLAQADILPPQVNPYRFEAVRGPGGVTLSGDAPNRALRADILEAARAAFGDVPVDDAMRLSRGAPAGFAGGVGFLIGRLSELSEGRATLEDRTMSLTGMTPDGIIAESLLRRLETLPRGFERGTIAIGYPAVSPYVHSVERTADRVILSGSAPDGATRAALREAVETAFPGVPVRDDAVLAGGAPRGFLAAAGFGIGQLSRLSTGAMTQTDARIALRGVAPDFATYDAVTARLAAPPRGITIVESAIAPPTPSPYVFTATRTGDALMLGGYLPDEAARSRVLAAAAALPAAVTDGTRLAPGAPERFGEMAAAAIGHLGRLVEGGAEIADTAYTVRGAAGSVAAFDAVMVEVGALPAGFSLSSAVITAPEPPAPTPEPTPEPAPVVIPIPEPAPVVLPAPAPALPRVEPFVVEITKGAGLSIAGYAPTPEAREALLAKARAAAPGLAVEDTLSIAEGLPAGVDYGAATAFLVDQVAPLERGFGRLVGEEVLVTGEARTVADHDGITARLTAGALPGGVRLAFENVMEPLVSPYRWRAVRAPGRLELTGHAPSLDDKIAVLAEAQSLFPGSAIEDRVEIGRGAPGCYPTAVRTALSNLARLNFGVADLEDVRLTLMGEAQTEAAVADIAASVATGAGAGCVGLASVQAAAPEPQVEAEVCQALFRDLLAEGPILFDKDSAQIKPVSFGTLDRLARAAQRCEELRIEIGAHTDSDASAAYNRTLSQARAASIVDYLVKTGVAATRLDAVGYGETQPVRTPDGFEDKLKSRRVEFRVLTP